MKHILRIFMIVIVLGVVVVVGGGETADAAKQTLTGQAAVNFLRENGIYKQLAAETDSSFSPAGREFFPTGQIGASDGYTDDLFGISVARDGDTILIGVSQADVGGNVDQGVAYVYTAFGSDGWALEAKLMAEDGAADDRFGFAVALDGDTALAGAYQADNDGNSNQGAAYIFSRTGVFWNQTAKLMAASGSAGDEFGQAVAMDSGVALIGAPSDDVNGNVDQGAAYVFTQSGSSWNQTAVLTSSDTAAGDQFGNAVALDGSTALVGAPFEDIGFDENQGAAYIFTGSGGSWSQQDRLATGDGMENDRFGGAVALDGDTALIGAHLADVDGDDNQGAAYVFTREGNDWSQQTKLTADDGATGDRLGRSVAVAGDTVLLGAPRTDIDSNSNQGAAYVFIRDNGSWSQQSKLTDWSNGEAGDRFGRSVALDGDTALVGAIYAQPPFGNADRGAVYPYARSNVPWLPDGEALASDGTEGDLFGRAVALDGDRALVGSLVAPGNNGDYQGAAYIFERSVNTWVQVAKLMAGDGEDFEEFGRAVALDGDTALVGAPQASAGGNNPGAAYVFIRSSNSWSQQAKLIATDGAQADEFGRAVALDGNTALVGARAADILGAENQGAAYIFTRSGNSWSQQAKLTASDGAEDDRLGYSVALDGNTALVGAYYADINGNERQGAVYAFTGSGSSWSEENKLTATYGDEYDFFGISVAVKGDIAVVGASGVDLGINPFQGAAYVFTRNGGSWSQQSRLVAADGKGDDYFGVSVVLESNAILVGTSTGNAAGTENSGAAYLFTRDGSSWRQQAKLTASDAVAEDRFGSAVALSGDIVLVGAYGVDVNSNEDQGKVYFFRRQPYEIFLPVVIR